MSRNKQIAYLLTESTSTPELPQILDLNGPARIRTSLQDTEVWNRNTRKYYKKDLKEGLEAPHIKEQMDANSWVGEAGHPMKPDLQRQMSIDNKNISHRINSWLFEGNVLKGEVEAIDGGEGSVGRLFHNCIRQRMKVAFSLRAVGPVQETPQGKIVKSPIRIVTYDWVFLPSHKIAYQDDVINTINMKVSESNNTFISENYMIPIFENQAVEYVKDKSSNLKHVSELFEFCYDNISLSQDKKKIIVSEGVNSLIINIDKELSREVCNEYLSQFGKLF